MQSIIKPILLVLLWAMMWLPSAVYAEHDSFEKMGVVPPRTSEPAPDFAVKNLQGKTVHLSDYKGKVLLINFWATWCGACREEMASMQNLYSELRSDGLEVLAVSIDRWNEDRIQEYVKDKNLTFPVLLDQNQEVRKKYHVMGLPTSYLVDGEGKIRGFASGARDWDSQDSKEMMMSLKGIATPESLSANRLSLRVD